MINTIKKNWIIYIKWIFVVCLFIVIACLYPFQNVKIAENSYLPLPSEDWKECEEIVLSQNNTISALKEMDRNTKVRSITIPLEVKEYEEGDMILLSVTDAENNEIEKVTIPCSIIQDKRVTFELKNAFIKEGQSCYITAKYIGKGNAIVYAIHKKAIKYIDETYYNNNEYDNRFLVELETIEYVNRVEGAIIWVTGSFFAILLMIPWKKCRREYLVYTVILGSAMILCLLHYYAQLRNCIKGYDELGKIISIIYIISIGTILCHMFFSVKKAASSVERYMLVSLLGWGIVYLLLMPPYQYPDEPTHFAQTNAFVNSIMGEEVKDEDGQIYIRNEDLIEGEGFPSADSLHEYYDMCLSRKPKEGIGIMDTVNGQGMYRASFVCYFPFEVGLFIARVLNINSTLSFTIINMCGLLFYSAITLIALKIMPSGKWILYMISQFPLALNTATSITYDLVNFSFIILWFAIYYRMLMEKETIKWKEVIALFLVSVCVFPIKYAYLPILFLLLFIPTGRFRENNHLKIAVFKIGFVLLCLLFILKDNVVVSHFEGNMIAQDSIYNNSVDIEELYAQEGNPYQSITELLADKGSFLKFLYNTVYRNIDYYINGMVGDRIGWGDSLIPHFVINMWWVLLLLSIIGTDIGKEVLPNRERVLVICMCVLCIGAVFGAMIFFSTPKGYTDCPSIGARYIVPLLFPICIAVRGRGIALKNAISEEILVLGADICQLLSIIYILSGYINR